MIIIFFIIRLFCFIATFKILKYGEDFYEVNPLMRKILNCRGGKTLAVIYGYFCLSIFLVCNIMIQINYPKYIWIFTIPVLILLIGFVYEFFNDLIYYLRDRKVKSELRKRRILRLSLTS